MIFQGLSFLGPSHFWGSPPLRDRILPRGVGKLMRDLSRGIGHTPYHYHLMIHQVAYENYDLEDEEDDRNSSKDSPGRERSSTRTVP